ncbi:GNAT family N-acetyltransferase [Siminovitchia fordii]|uniref:N-acetyltransferase n=1 Tax=Siminovitchia fordii TaxID=254759 RepID=A0ABQ4KBE0_9BACI|nr:GNAT family N-acetyltransferase [Siminovitchia fordii]GIN22326.1 N-acetyltransferase [Siminovitchia fordii]
MDTIGVEYRRLKSGDDSQFSDLVLLFNEEFESPTLTYVNTKNIRKLLNNPKFVCIVAQIDHKIIGGLTAYELEMYDREGSSMYIYDLAVSKEYQRNGIGSRLVHKIIMLCKSKVIEDLFVQADGVDQHAISFYKKIGGKQSKTFQFSFNPLDY